MKVGTAARRCDIGYTARCVMRLALSEGGHREIGGAGWPCARRILSALRVRSRKSGGTSARHNPWPCRYAMPRSRRCAAGGALDAQSDRHAEANMNGDDGDWSVE